MLARVAGFLLFESMEEQLLVKTIRTAAATRIRGRRIMGSARIGVNSRTASSIICSAFCHALVPFTLPPLVYKSR